MNPFLPDCLSAPAPSAATRERRPLARRGRTWSRVRVRPPGDYDVVCVIWSAGDDGEHAWFWQAKNAAGRTLAYGYAHTQDEDAVVKAIGEDGAEVADGCEWVVEA